jgi:hypothetical protein
LGNDDPIHGEARGGDLIAAVPPVAAPPPGQPELDAGLAAAVERVRAVSATLTAFEQAGCAVTDQFLSCTVTIPPAQSHGVPHRALIDAIADVADIHLRFDLPPVSFELSAVAGATLDFMGEPAGDPSSAFEGKELTRARRAWKGDINVAMSLTGQWSGDLTVHLAAALQNLDAARAWRAVRSTAVVVQELSAYPWWRTGELIHDGNRGVVVAVVNESPVDLQTPSFAVVSLDRLVGSGPAVPRMVDRRSQVRSSSTTQLLDGVPLPEELEPKAGFVGASALAEMLRPRADACAWAWLCNAMTVAKDQQGSYARLEFFGYRRRVFMLRPPGYAAAPEHRALDMYKWATAETSPDRVLAICQVVSLHEGPDLPTQPEDIVRAAEPLYQALRAGEVAAVLESQRQARSIAVESARGSADAAQAAAKSTAERTIASLAGVAGIAVANATAVLSDKNAVDLALGIAGLFLFLAAWAIFVEGPTMRAPLNSFAADLPTIGYLLPEADRTAILNMDVLKTASHAVLRVRILAPIVYVAGTAVSVLVAHARFGLHL